MVTEFEEAEMLGLLHCIKITVKTTINEPINVARYFLFKFFSSLITSAAFIYICFFICFGH